MQATMSDQKKVVPMQKDIEEAYCVSSENQWLKILEGTFSNLMPLVADLLDVGRKLFCEDCSRRRSKQWSRSFEITLDLREPERWNRPEVLRAFENALYILGEDKYKFKIAPARIASQSNLPLCLPFENDGSVCLFSDGLDSLCGLISRLHKDESRAFYAVSAPAQNSVKGHISARVSELNAQFGNRITPISLSINRNKTPNRAHEESSQRTRSILLLILGSAVALQAGQRQVEIYENGIEIFNFPLYSALETRYLSRPMHPLLLAECLSFYLC